MEEEVPRPHWSVEEELGKEAVRRGAIGAVRVRGEEADRRPLRVPTRASPPAFKQYRRRCRFLHCREHRGQGGFATDSQNRQSLFMRNKAKGPQRAADSTCSRRVQGLLKTWRPDRQRPKV